MSGNFCAFIISSLILLLNLSFFKPVVYMAEDDEFVGEERILPHMAASEGLVEFLCTGNARCIPLSSCQPLFQLIEKSCLNINKLRDFTCGYKADEPLVCCPQCSRDESPIGGFPAKPPPRPSNNKQCGHPQLYNWQGTNYKGIGSHPWVVRVGFKNKVTKLLEHPCCGSIIAPRVVLTTAHCALKNPDTLSIVSVRVGEYDISQNPDCTPTFCALPVKDVPLSHVVIHPGYSSKTYRHNIALLVLKQRLNYSVTVQPVCLQQTHSPLEGNRALLVGWGRVPGDTDVRKRQQQIDLPVIGLDRCVRVYGGSVPLSMNEICVGGEEGKDACSGFGGAPLVLMDKITKGHFTQIGIVSFGSEKCGVEGIPSVYVRVDQYLDWIKLNSPNEG